MTLFVHLFIFLLNCAGFAYLYLSFSVPEDWVELFLVSFSGSLLILSPGSSFFFRFFSQNRISMISALPRVQSGSIVEDLKILKENSEDETVFCERDSPLKVKPKTLRAFKSQTSRKVNRPDSINSSVTLNK
jgi:hypothetical protein